MVYACRNTFLCHRSWSMHPFPKPKQRKRSSVSSKETETDQCKYLERHRQAEPYIETVWPKQINRVQTVMMRWMVRQLNGDHCCSWPN